MDAILQQSAFAAELRDISVTFGSDAALVRAVRNVTLEVHRGEVLLLVGPSGSGKTTLLQVLGCLRHATEGTVLINGRPVRGLTENELSHVRCDRIGFVFQNYNLLPSLSAWENVALALELRGVPGPDIEQASRRILSRVGLENRADTYPDVLSGGEKQRVAIARAVVGEPDIILADEPTAALDTVSGGEIAKLLATMAHEHGHAVVIVTHDPRISGIADKIVFLEDGAIRSTKKNIRAQKQSILESGFHEREDYNRADGSVDSGVARRIVLTA